MQKTMAIIAVLLFPGLAHADQKAASQCRSGLKPEARLIYDKTLPMVTPTTVIRDALQTETRSLVSAGSVSMRSARGSAEAAGACFQALRQ